MRGLAAIALIVMTTAAAHAEAPKTEPAPPHGRALTAVGPELVRSGLRRLAPALVGRIRGGFDADPAAGEALAKALAASAVTGLADAHGARFTLVQRDGLTAGGAALVAFLDEAHLHGLDVRAPEAAKALTSHAASAPAALPTIAPGDLEAAWREGAAGGEGEARLDAAAKALGKRLPEMSSAGALPLATRVELEVQLAEALARVIAELPARPRAEPVLKHAERDYYLSPDVLWRDVPRPTATPEALAAGLAAARAGTLAAHLSALAPKHPQYAALVAAAARYQGLCAAGPWPEVPVPANEKASKKPEAVTALQARLAREGYYEGAPSGQWDATTEAAVMSYRRLHQLKDKKPDFDKDLVKSLSVPCVDRLKTLVLNVRRWRHTAWSGEHESVQVNLAGQMMRLFRDDQLVMAQRTVVGSDRCYFNETFGRRHCRNSTPILKDQIEQVIVNPEWNVPGRIAREEIGPEIDKDPEYLEKNRFRTKVGKDGATYYVQESGPGNALGRIKVLFPNSESVYLHDTPGRAAFNLPVRALSHGCVRVQNAVDFGAEIVRADKVKSGETFEAETIKGFVANSHMQRVFDIVHPVPVFFEYYTASVDEAGALWFHPDVYGYDADTFDAAAVSVQP